MNTLTFQGLDGSNPLAFLAACGAQRLATLRWPNQNPTLHWSRQGVWVPVISGVPVQSSEHFAQQLAQAPSAPIEYFEKLGKNITVHPDQFFEFALNAEQDPLASAFAAAFGSEACQDDKGDRIRYTELCFITGSGHQDFLGSCKELREKADSSKIHRALFELLDDSDKGLSFRWSPSDARHYARRWNNPGPEGAWTSWGANRLAFEALPLFPTQPTAKRLLTTGFRRANRRTEFTWPIWKTPLNLDEMKSLFTWSGLHEETLDSRKAEGMGIDAAFRSARIRIGKGANFKVSFLPAKAI